MQSKQVDFLVAILSDSDGDGDYTNLVLSQPKLEGSYPEEEGKCQRLHSGGLYKLRRHQKPSDAQETTEKLEKHS